MSLKNLIYSSYIGFNCNLPFLVVYSLLSFLIHIKIFT
nr:MAG TPA: hypothetical protein [Caudoviricetes sp.]